LAADPDGRPALGIGEWPEGDIIEVEELALERSLRRRPEMAPDADRLIEIGAASVIAFGGVENLYFALIPTRSAAD
jgi:hypothetical protein